MAAVILLLPIKLLGKAMCHIAAAVFGAAGFLIALAGALTQRVGAFIGGLCLLSVIAALIFQAGTSFMLAAAAAGVALILSPFIVIAIAGVMYAIREALLNISEEIDLY